ncbi:MAG: hypothetical protein M3158_05255, partial [Pseudomonadota bacterium]|nr:hypothetical protein [Pseudomonadota bacterium]
MKLLSVPVFFLALGLPVNRLPEFLVFAAALFLMIFGCLRAAAWRVLLAFSLVLGAAVLARLIEPPAIDEGFNVFLFESDPGALRTLPPEVLAAMEGDLRPVLDRYQCDKAQGGCWRHNAVTPERLHVFSGDGALDAAPGFSRRVRDIGFSHRDQLFSAAINRFPRHNYYGAQRNPDRQHLPVFVTHRFPPEYEGSALCWTGVLARPSEGGADILRSPDRQHCLVLDSLDRRPLTVAYGIDPALPFAVRLDRTWSLALRDGVARAAVILAVIAALGLLVDFRRRERLLVPALALGGTLLWAAGWDLTIGASALLDGLNIYKGGNDGLVHDSFAREVLFQAASGNWLEALKGSEAVFY